MVVVIAGLKMGGNDCQQQIFSGGPRFLTEDIFGDNGYIS